MRVAEKPLTARDCADYMGFTPAWIRRAIVDGVQVQARTIRLEAETLEVNGRRTYRVHMDSFSDFLQAIGWKHLPKRSSSTNGSNGQETAP